MSGTIVNSSLANTFYNVSGSTISAQPKLGGASAGTGKTNTFYDYVGQGVVDEGFIGSRIYATAKAGIMTTKLGNSVNITSVASVGGYARFTLNSHSLVVNDVIYVTEANLKCHGPQRVTAKTTNNFTTDRAYASGSHATIAYKLISGSLGYGTGVGNRYSVLRKVNTTINNVANTAMQSGAAPDAYRQSPHKITNGVRTMLTATAIRAGYWNEYAGTWSTAPSAGNGNIAEVSGSLNTSGTADNAASVSRSVAGELVYRYGAAAAATADYNLPTS